MDYIKNRIQRHNRKGIMVGITTRCSAYNIQWLKDFLTEKFQDLILDVEHLLITNTNRYEWENNVNKYSVVILYHTQHQGRANITDVDGGIYDEELKYLFNKLGKEKILVVLDDMEDISKEQRQRILESQPSLTRLSSHLILLPKFGKDGAASRKREEFLTVFGSEQTTSCADRNIPDQTTSWTGPDDNNILGNGYWPLFSTQSPYKKNRQPSLAKYTVGIFSRSGDDNYQWLVGSLQKVNIGRSIDVCKVYISNNYHSYYSEMSRCNFAILYHTQKQGRLNITDVTDSLYDQELKELSEFLGKENVIVVVDDLMEASNEEKQSILKYQPSIGSLAGGLFLFSEQHKDPETVQEIATIIGNDGGRENVIRVGIKEKLQIWENKQNKDPQMTLIENDEQTTSSDDENIMDHTSSRTCMYPGDICDHRSFITTRNRNPRSSLAKYTVGIFSRSGDDNYQWLVGSLQAANIGRSIDVCNVYISNNYQSFYSKLSRCNFAILYHTKNQGRLNITDVTDAIYNQELRELSGYLGKENVIVVVDDLMDPSNEEKQRILENQPSIGSLANDLFLFSEQHKDPETLREITTLIAKNGKENFIVTSENLIDTSNEEKQQTMHDLILFTEEYKDQETPQPMMTLEKGIGVDESRTMKLSPVSALQYIGAQEVEQRQGPPQNICDESILTDNDGSALHHLRGAIRRKPSGVRYNTDSLFSDIYTSRKRPNYNPCAYDHEPSSSLKKKNSFEEQEAINISDDTADKDSWMDNRLRVLNDTGSAFFAQLSELNDSWRRFRRAAQNPQSEIQQLLGKTHTQAEELKEKDIVILNLRKEVYRLQSEEKQKTIEGKDKFIEELKDNRDRLVDKTQEGRREHPSGTLEEIIQKKEKAIMKLRAEIQNLREKPQDQETSEALQGPLRKRRGAKKWTSEDTKHEQDGGLDAHNTSEPETSESHSTIEDLWQRIAELESRLKHLEYTTENQRQELDKYRQTVKEQSSKLKGYEDLVDSLLGKNEDIRQI